MGEILAVFRSIFEQIWNFGCIDSSHGNRIESTFHDQNVEFELGNPYINRGLLPENRKIAADRLGITRPESKA